MESEIRGWRRNMDEEKKTLFITIEQVVDGYQYNIEGLHKLGGKRVAENTREYPMLERICESILGYKVIITRK